MNIGRIEVNGVLFSTRLGVARRALADQIGRTWGSPAVILRSIRRTHGRDGVRWFIWRLVIHQGRCELCGGRDTLVVDHSHKTGFLRGLLCSSCNNAMTDRWEDFAWMKRALAYLLASDSKIPYGTGQRERTKPELYVKLKAQIDAAEKARVE